MPFDDLPAPLVRAPDLVPMRRRSAVTLSIPHSGRDYPAWVLQRARSGRRALERLEDPFVDRLAWRLLSAGHGAVIARTPRAGIDCNRAPDDLDPRAIRGRSGPVDSARARVGLGLVPTRIAPFGDLWRRPLEEAEFLALMHGAYLPFHEGVAAQLARAGQGGPCLLLDLHSMPARPSGGPQIVIGDRYGTSADPSLSALSLSIAEGAGFRAARNDPFAGGHVIERHGDPARGVHALQVEICRSAYLARDGQSAGAGFERVALFLDTLARALDDALGGGMDAIAAE